MSASPIKYTSGGIERIALPLAQRRHEPVLQIIVSALKEELLELREQNDMPDTIGNITYRQGGIALLKRILARLEVGPESRQSEGFNAPESAFPTDPDFGAGPLNGD